MSLIYHVGDATKPPGDDAQIIAHVCNDSGNWGKGFVVALSKRSKEPEKVFRAWFQAGEGFRLGAVQFVFVDERVEVANIIGQHGVARAGDAPATLAPVRYEAIREGLQAVANRAIERGASVHLPRLGCGLAGGKWEIVESLIDEECVARGVETFIYDLPS